MGIINEAHPPADAPQAYPSAPTIPAINAEGLSIEEIHAGMSQLDRSFGEHLAQVDGYAARRGRPGPALTSDHQQPAPVGNRGNDMPPHMSDGELMQLRRAIEPQATAALDSYVTAAESALRQAQERERAIVAGLHPANDVGAQRSWARAERTLDAARPGAVGDIARGLIEAAKSDEEVATLAEELPSYLAAKGVPSDVVDQALANKLPELAAARRAVRDNHNALSVIKHNAEKQKRELRDGRRSGVPLIDPTKLPN